MRAVSNAANAPVVIWDGGVWDFEEGVDFGEVGEDGRLRKIVTFFGLLPFGR